MANLREHIVLLVGILLLYEEAVSEEYTIYKYASSKFERNSYMGGSCLASGSSFPQKDHQNYYRYLEPSPSNQHLLYVGAMNYLLVIDTNDMNCTKSQHLPPDNTTQDRCSRQGKVDVPDCQNHIREAFEENNQLEVCGTGAYRPIMYYLNVTDIPYKADRLPSLTLNRTGDISVQPTCPYDPLDNNTLLYSRQGNPGNSPAKYFGFYTDFIKNFPVFMRPRYTYSGVTYVEKMTDMEDANWLNFPQFVGSFDIWSSVMMFFRETAVENAASTGKVYSRVGKVCKNDLGGGTADLAKKKWLSFQKARLICSLPGSQPYYFDNIYDVAYDGSDHFYAIFYKQGADLNASAICMYSIQNINTSFEGPFMFKNGSEVTPSPNPRLDDCALHDADPAQFVGKTSQYQLMYIPVQPMQGKPIFYQHGVQLLRLALGPADNSQGHRNIYVGTSEGEVYDIFVNGTSWATKLNAVTQPFGLARPDRPIWELMLKENYLIAATDYSVTKINLDTCSEISAMDECLYNTRCKIKTQNKIVSTCELAATCNDINKCKGASDVEQGANVREYILNQIEFNVSLVPDSAVVGTHLTLAVVYPLRLNSLTWSKADRVLEPSARYTFSGNELIIKNITEGDGGTYFARSEDNTTVAKFNVTVDKDTEASLIAAWKQQFTDWSSAFNQWKYCSKPYLESCPGG